MLATFWRQATPGSAYYRCDLPARHLPGQVVLFNTLDLEDDGNEGVRFPRQTGAAVWQFAANATRGLTMAAMQEQGTRVLLELDDNYLIGGPIRRGNQWVNTIEEAMEDGVDKHNYEAHARIAEFVDGIIVSTEALKDAYQGLNPNIYVCPNMLDLTDWGHRKPDDGVWRIGYAGSDSHIHDVPLIMDALEWAADQPGVEVWVFGAGLNKFGRKIRRIRWTDSLEEYRRNLAMLDVGLCPLVETPWSRCKSDVKCLELLASGACPIVSPVEPYKDWVLRVPAARTRKDWLKAVRWAVYKRDEVRELADRNFSLVKASRLIQDTVGLWREAITSNGSLSSEPSISPIPATSVS